eukprot:Phypoly_transcript_14756.p1 GENE.Phypoly_transcript_14756~~Phypoly_transcript_14756.p1  ORF type:complete len:268 (+),score=13.25 Phypoly_transcript_14756:89-892(+)
MLRLIIFLFALLGTSNVYAACVNGPNSSACSLTLPTSFNVNTTVNITFSQGTLTFQQIFGNFLVNTFSFQASSPAPEGATCSSNEQLSWCLLFVNYANNGQTASADIVSTFVQRGSVWTGDQGSYYVRSNGDLQSSVATSEFIESAPLVCGRCVPGCYCTPGRGCLCCPSNNVQDTCVQLAGVGDIKYLQATVVFDNLVWFISSSYVSAPQPVCTVNDQIVGPTLCIDFVDLTFNPSGIYGNVVLIYFKGSNMRDGTTIYLGNFRLV